MSKKPTALQQEITIKIKNKIKLKLDGGIWRQTMMKCVINEPQQNRKIKINLLKMFSK
jgi:hypothetical protein